MSSGTFATFSKIHLNTSKSTFTKVVHLVEGHNFHVDWHFKLSCSCPAPPSRLGVRAAACLSCDVIPRSTRPGDRRSDRCGTARARSLIRADPPALARAHPLPSLPRICPLQRAPAAPAALPAAAAAPGCRHTPPPKSPLPRPTPQTEPLATPRPSPVLSQPRTPASSPNSGEQYRCLRPRGNIAKVKIFPGSFLQKCNSNSVVILLFLVNCVENDIKIRKM
jgi:hypothetical protein